MKRSTMDTAQKGGGFNEEWSRNCPTLDVHSPARHAGRHDSVSSSLQCFTAATMRPAGETGGECAGGTSSAVGR